MSRSQSLASAPEPQDQRPSISMRVAAALAPQRGRAARYALAVALSGLAFSLTVLLGDRLQPTLFILFWPAVIASALYGGLGPAIAASLIGVLGVDYFLVPPVHTLTWEKILNHPALFVFLLTAASVGWLADALRLARVAAQKEAARNSSVAAELERRAASLEHQLGQAEALSSSLEESSRALASANEQLERNRRFLEQAQASAQLGSWEWDVQTNRVTWSDEMFRVYGREPGTVDVSYEAFLEFVHPDDREAVHRTVSETFRTHRPFSFEHRIVRPDGVTRWLHGRGSVIVNPAGEPIRMIGSGQDVTDRRRSADADRLILEVSNSLAASLDYNVTLRRVAELVAGAVGDWCTIAVGDESGRYATVAIAHRDSGKEDWVKALRRLHPPEPDNPRQLVAEALRSGRAALIPEVTRSVLEKAARSPEELETFAALGLRSLIFVPMVARGRTLGVITLATDESLHRLTEDDLHTVERVAHRAAVAVDNAHLYTQARAAEAIAVQANRAKTEFLAAVSHELRTPLNAILGYIELLEMEIHGRLSAPQREMLARMRRSERHLHGLIEDVLGFAKLEVGRLEFNIRSVPVGHVLTRVGDVLGPELMSKQLRYDYRGCDPALTVRADHERLEQIVLNLLANAVKFTPPGGTVSLAVDSEQDTVVVRVSDTGIGIPSEKLETIFEPFVQLSRGIGNSQGLEGTGLGLAISRGLARAMDGDISVSSSPGAGSTFTVRLPRASADRSETDTAAVFRDFGVASGLQPEKSGVEPVS